MTKNIPCPDCNGNGFVSVFTECSVLGKKCHTCDGSGHIEVPTTNADRIREMSDEELAEKLILFNDIEGIVPFCKDLPECEELLDTDSGISLSKCQNCLLKWLKQPAKGE